MDVLDHDPAVLADNLDDLRRVNRVLGGVWLTLRGLGRLTADLAPGDQLSVLDLATGGADIARAILSWARRRGLRACMLATDFSPAIVDLARRDAPAALQFAFIDARVLPFADRSIDVVTCSLVLHHLIPSDAIRMLREMRRVARRGVVVNDIRRNWLGYGGAWLLARAFSGNPLTRHDGPLSVRRAYTRAEMTKMAAEAGLGPLTFDGFAGYRYAITARS